MRRAYRAPRNPSASTSTADRASVAADSFRITGVGKSSTLTSSISRSKAQVASRTALETRFQRTFGSVHAAAR